MSERDDEVDSTEAIPVAPPPASDSPSATGLVADDESVEPDVD